MAAGCGGGDGDTAPFLDAPGTTPACTTVPDNCGGETICGSAGACVAAFPRVYAITQVMLRVPTTDPDGLAWDAGGGAPDLLLTISVDGVAKHTTPVTAPDQFQATFAGPFDVQLVGGSNLRIDSFDEDVTVNDPAFACVLNPVDAAKLRARAISCTLGGNSMTYSIRPK